MTTLKHHDHHISLTPAARKIVSFIIALAVTMILFNVMAIGHARAEPTAWGQPMPTQCVTRFEWKSPSTYPVHVYDAPGCARPWAENAVSFWRWFQSKTAQPK